MLRPQIQIARIALLFSFLSFFCIAHAQLSTPKFSIDASTNYLKSLESWIVWEGQEFFDFSDLSEVEVQKESVVTFIENRVFPLIPERLQKHLKNKQIRFFFTHKCRSSAFFFEPLHPRMPIRVCFRPEVFLTQRIFGLVAHELFHVLHFLTNPREEQWLKEGLAVWFEYQVTKRFPVSLVKEPLTRGRMRFGEIYDHDVTDEKDSELIAKYGRDFLFVYFLQLRFTKGNPSRIWDLVDPYAKASERIHGKSVTGKRNVEKFVDQSFTFEQLILDYEIARNHNHITFDAEGNDKTYFLTRTPFFVAPEITMHTEMERLLASLKLGIFESVLLQWNEVKDKLDILESSFKSFPGYHFVWLESVAPYRVMFDSEKLENLPPEEFQNFNLLIHRSFDSQ